MARTAAQASGPLELENMSDGELRELRARIDQLLDTRVKSRFDEYRQFAKEAGYEASFTRIGEDLRRQRTGSGARQRQDQRRGPLPPKYRNPDNHSEIWSGRGIEPKWLRDLRASTGKPREEFLIERQERLPLGEQSSF